VKDIFIKGAIKAEFITESIQKHSSKTAIGAHQIFLGQVREDETENGVVEAIDFTAHEELAKKTAHLIREETFDKFDVSCMHIYHSLGRVKKGEICFFVFVSSPHRKESTEACSYLVERIKSEVPIYGKELIAEGGHQWKKNKT